MAASQATIADPVSNAVVSPEASLFTREILTKALTAGVDARWKGAALALLANVLMNDYLNWWNHADEKALKDAQDKVDEAMKLPPGQWLALAHHVQGLIYRATGEPNLARKAFKEAKQLDSEFARAHAQFGNQKAALSRSDEVQNPLDKAIELGPSHPASGYFYWAKGRGYFQEATSSDNPDWSNAIKWLRNSVKALSTVWYNRCYLAAAQDAAGNSTAAKRTLRDFINRFDQATFTRIKGLKPDPKDPARKRMLDFVQPRLP